MNPDPLPIPNDAAANRESEAAPAASLASEGKAATASPSPGEGTAAQPHPAATGGAADSSAKAQGNHLPRPSLLRPAEQATLAVVTAILLVVSGVIWWQRGGPSQVEFEDRPQFVLDYQIDINRCGWPELAQVSGIGETLAKRIMELRDERQGFQQLREILDVKGIAPKKFAELEPHVLPIVALKDQSESASDAAPRN